MRAVPLPGRHLPATTAPGGFSLAGNTTGEAAQFLPMGISDLEVGLEEFGSQGWRGDGLCSCSPPSATGLASSASTGGWCKFWGSFVSRLWRSCPWRLINISASTTTASFPNMLTISSRNLKVNSLRMLRMRQKQLSKEPFNLWYLWKRSK